MPDSHLSFAGRKPVTSSQQSEISQLTWRWNWSHLYMLEKKPLLMVPPGHPAFGRMWASNKLSEGQYIRRTKYTPKINVDPMRFRNKTVSPHPNSRLSGWKRWKKDGACPLDDVTKVRSLSTLSVGGGVSARCIQNSQAQEEPMCPLVHWPEEGSPPGKKRAVAKPRDKLVPEQAECFWKGPGTDVLSLASGITHRERPEIGWRRDSDGDGRKESGWKARTKGNRAFLVLRPHRRQGGKERASSADTKLGSEREGMRPRWWTWWWRKPRQPLRRGDRQGPPF